MSLTSLWSVPYKMLIFWLNEHSIFWILKLMISYISNERLGHALLFFPLRDPVVTSFRIIDKIFKSCNTSNFKLSPKGSLSSSQRVSKPVDSHDENTLFNRILNVSQLNTSQSKQVNNTNHYCKRNITDVLLFGCSFMSFLCLINVDSSTKMIKVFLVHTFLV